VRVLCDSHPALSKSWGTASRGSVRRIPAGDKARGKVAFDIKPGTSTVIITNAILQEDARISVTP
jgi:hypothetical protein